LSSTSKKGKEICQIGKVLTVLQTLGSQIALTPQVVSKNASSAEPVSGFGFGQSSKRVIPGHFHRFDGAKPIRASGYHSYFVIEPFHRAA
jgi:hypothetical protein